MSSKNEIEKAAQKQKSKNTPEQKKPEEIPVDCPYFQWELQLMYDVFEEYKKLSPMGKHVADKLSHIQARTNQFVLEHCKKLEAKDTGNG